MDKKQSPKYVLDTMTSVDWQQVQNIYCEGLKTGTATFQTEVPSWDAWDKSHLNTCRLVARADGNILGWAALSPTSTRPCYAGVAEISLYIGNLYKGLGIGTSLLKEIISISEDNGIWSLFCVIIKENKGSIAMTKKCGFREIGTREKIAKLNDGLWHDTVLFERRSKKVGL